MKQQQALPLISSMINVTEIFKSIQGESTRAGEVCSFVRLTGCNLHCSWCDTEYARTNGTPMSIDDIAAGIISLKCSLVEITGGEPLLQNETPGLCEMLIKSGHTVMVETNGSLNIGCLPRGVIRIVDVKCPQSKMCGSFLLENINKLNTADELKFVIAGTEDFQWALDFVYLHGLDRICRVIFSPVGEMLSPKNLAELIVANNAPVRLGLQIHKIIWGREAKGV